MRVAIVHDWLVTYAGSERVLEQMIALFPQADIFALVDFLSPDDRKFLGGRKVTTTFLQRLPFARSKYQTYLPLMPLAIEQLDLSAYDLVLSSSHCVAKGVLVGPDQLHVSYIHSPMRYAWDAQAEYLETSRLEHGPRSWLTRYLLHKLRQWDARSANGVDLLLANSRFIARRIAKCYRREAQVVHPPVDTAAFALSEDREDFYLTVSRLAPYKRADVLVRAFASLPERRLVVIGDGPQLQQLRGTATPNVQLLGYQSTATVRSYLQRARAFLFAAREDFGIVPVEAQAAGCPVIAFGRGGVVESIRGLDDARPTGVFFDEQTPESVQAAVAAFEANCQRIQPGECRANALRFSAERFRQEYHEQVMTAWHAFREHLQPNGPARRAGTMRVA